MPDQGFSRNGRYFPNLFVHIRDKRGEPISEFEVNHEKLLHLIIVSRALASFSHLHPTYKGNGVFQTEAHFPSGGDYKCFADFKPIGYPSVTKESGWIAVEGKQESPANLRPDANLTQTVEDKEVSLSFDKLVPNKQIRLRFSFHDAATKKPVTDLQPYLGAVGHVVILSEGAERYLHVHPIEESATGPEAEFATEFPRGGLYKIWGQFKHAGEVLTVSFVVNVSEE